MDITSYLMGRSAGSKSASTVVVEELPETGQSNVIYLVPKQTTGDNDIFDEYIWVNNDWELIGSTAIDISGKQDTMQFSTMPTASANTVGKIVQYTGTTNNNYTNGYFYIGISTTENDVTTYSWSNINVQDTSNVSGVYCIKGEITTTSNSDTRLYLKNDIVDKFCEVFTQAEADGYYGKNIVIHVIDSSSGTVTLPYITLAGNFVYVNGKVTLVSTSVIAFNQGAGGTQAYGKQFIVSANIYCNYSSGVYTRQGTSSSLDLTQTNLINYLSKTNTTSYTPSANYHPATKKYVDDTTLLKSYQLAGLSEYSSSSTYAVDDYVYYNNLIYKCNTTISTAEAWDSTKWTQKTYMEYMSDVLVGNALGGSY